MNPKEKAQELLGKFKATRLDILTRMDSIPTVLSDFATAKTAKQLALIAVEEIMKVLPAFDFNYWQQVKEEIEST